jgi:LuxR family transcriptional regulator, maltose regulon positive regulatory protein
MNTSHLPQGQAQQRAGRPRGANGPVFDLTMAKLLPPAVRPETIRRASLIERLAGPSGAPVVSVVAPAGYGKTTLLAQWAQRDPRSFVWVSADERDNDPKVLLSYVAEALNTVEPVSQRVFDALASAASSVPGSVVPRLSAALVSLSRPVVLVLDDVHVLHNVECWAALSVLAGHVPGGSRLVLAGRAEPPVRVGRLRAEGRLAEIGPADLSLTVPEAASLLRGAGVLLDDGDVAELHSRTEGWPAGLYLAALYLREGGSPLGAASFGGDDRLVSQYVESEFLAWISTAQREFLTMTAVLERMSGPLCDAILGVAGSAVTLAELARSNLLLVPLDRRGHWYRYHHLLRDLLLAELERTRPGLLPVLRRRAAAWYLEQDLPEEAVEHSILAGDVETVARLVQTLWSPVYRQGRTATLQRWFSWLEDRGGLDDYPLNATLRAFLAEKTGQPAQAERWADAVDRWTRRDPRPAADPYTQAMAAMLRAILCRGGAEQMRADSDEAARQFAAANFAPISTIPLLQGTAQVLRGDLDGGDAFFAEAQAIGEERLTPDILVLTLCQRSFVAIARNQWSQAEAFARRAHARVQQARVDDSYAAALTSAVQARVALRRGDLPAARRDLVNALRLRPLVTYAHPHWAVQFRITLIRVYLALGDVAGARTLMREIDEILRRRPGLGVLAGEADELRAELANERGPSVLAASTLTAAELRLLPMLSTHLQLHEIAAELYLSPHTVRTQSKSVYRKLGAPGRSQAVARAREVGLLEG